MTRVKVMDASMLCSESLDSHDVIRCSSPKSVGISGMTLSNFRRHPSSSMPMITDHCLSRMNRHDVARHGDPVSQESQQLSGLCEHVVMTWWGIHIPGVSHDTVFAHFACRVRVTRVSPKHPKLAFSGTPQKVIRGGHNYMVIPAELSIA